jgi:hypothetical protein
MEVSGQLCTPSAVPLVSVETDAASRVGLVFWGKEFLGLAGIQNMVLQSSL